MDAMCKAILFRTQLLASQTDKSYAQVKRIILSSSISIGSVLMLFLNCWADNFNSKEALSTSTDPELRASFLNRLFFAWFTQGNKKTLSAEDYFAVPQDLQIQDSADKFDQKYFAHIELTSDEGKVLKSDEEYSQQPRFKQQSSVLPSLARAFGPKILIANVLVLAHQILDLSTPIIMKRLIEFVGNSDEPDWKGYSLAVLLLLCVTLKTLLFNQYKKSMTMQGLKIRSSLISAVYRKILSISQSTKKDISVGEVVNIVSTDISKFDELLIYMPMLWASPFAISVSIYFIYQEIGPAIFVGLAILLVTTPIMFFLGKYDQQFYITLMALKDKRIKSMNEILSGIKVLKLYGWEEAFIELVSGYRKGEVKELKKIAIINIFMVLCFTIAPFMIGLAAFGYFVYAGNSLTASNAFVTLNYLQIMSFDMAVFPLLMAHILEFLVSLTRINKLLTNKEIDPKSVSHDITEHAVEVTNASFHWSIDDEMVLKDLNFTVAKGSACAIIGPVGSGKSSLLSSLLGELTKVKGSVNTCGEIAFVSQEAWIKNSTLQENILLCKDYDEDWYNEVIAACALQADLDLLADGDQTEIGEKGINLSGGQKQRVSLARAVYSRAELYLLDDPLSAVDAHVGKHIFLNVLGNRGLLQGSTRLLVTNGVTFLPDMDNILVLDDGMIREQGSYETLMSKNGKFAEYMTEYSNKDKNTDNEMQEEAVKGGANKQDVATSDEHVKQNVETKSRKDKQGGKLIEDENIETGRVKFEVYWYYIKTVGIFAFVLIALFRILHICLETLGNYWLIWWVEDSFETTSQFYLAIFGVIGILQGLTIMVFGGIKEIATLTGSHVLHRDMLMSVLTSPMSFFDTTPMGRIVNRFSEDINQCEGPVSGAFSEWMEAFFRFIGSIVSIVVVVPFIVAVFVPIAIIFYFIQKIFVTTSRQLTRIESVKMSPVYSHFGETLTGAITIRAFSLQEKFIQQLYEKVDEQVQCRYAISIADIWLAVRLETLGNIITFMSAFLAIFLRNSLSESEVGFVINYSLAISHVLDSLVTATAGLENSIVSVERIMEYLDLKPEAPWKNESKQVPDIWPQTGNIEINNLSIRYRDGLDLVLHQLSCVIDGGQKVGIVGRTGAGKSSVTVALFRLVEAVTGSIVIDDVDISEIGLHDLRQRLSIIPQDPVLFSGSLRMNLDPFGGKDDAAIWTALEQSSLVEFAQSLEGGLDHSIEEGGENLSVGQKQLICMARALLEKSQILVLDEATAAIDLKTDDLIQSTIRDQFAGCTVLTIAHRINTIMDYDKIMVLDKGELKEFDSPETLLKDDNGIFYSLVKNAGLINVNHSQQHAPNPSRGTQDISVDSLTFIEDVY